MHAVKEWGNTSFICNLKPLQGQACMLHVFVLTGTKDACGNFVFEPLLKAISKENALKDTNAILSAFFLQGKRKKKKKQSNP